MSQTAVEAGGTVNLSTTLDPNTVPLESGGGRPDLSKPEPSTSLDGADKGKDAPKKPVSVRETLDTENARLKAEADQKGKDAADAAKAKVGEGDGKAKADAKGEEEAKATGKFTKADADKAPEADMGAPEKAATGQGGAGERQSEGRKTVEPPARFLPEARTKWDNTPNEVKAEVHRLSQEYEGEIEKHRQAAERYESVRQFDEIARSNGRELKDTLSRVVQVEQALARNPIAGLEMILRQIGPVKADGTPLSLWDIAQSVAKQTPQQFAQTMNTALAPRPQPQGGQQQLPPAVQAMAKELQALRMEVAAGKVQPLIETFKASHPDYGALEEKIASVLSSGVVEKLYGTGLSPEQRLTEAYRMAGGSMSPSRSEAAAPSAHSDVVTVPPVNPEAGKSVRGAPNGGEDPPVERPKQSIRDLLKSEMRSIAG